MPYFIGSARYFERPFFVCLALDNWLVHLLENCPSAVNSLFKVITLYSYLTILCTIYYPLPKVAWGHPIAPKTQFQTSSCKTVLHKQSYRDSI